MNKNRPGCTRPDRRDALKAAAGAGLLAFAPEAALAAGQPAPALDTRSANLWSLWLEALVPGAAQAGAADYLQAQLALPRDHSALFLRYMDWPGDYRAFYRDGIRAVDVLAQVRHGQGFAELDAAARGALVGEIAAGAPSPWVGPPAGLFYFVCKADGADLVFGTHAGFKQLGLDYRAHVEPAGVWPRRA